MAHLFLWDNHSLQCLVGKYQIFRLIISGSNLTPQQAIFCLNSTLGHVRTIRIQTQINPDDNYQVYDGLNRKGFWVLEDQSVVGFYSPDRNRQYVNFFRYDGRGRLVWNLVYLFIYAIFTSQI